MGPSEASQGVIRHAAHVVQPLELAGTGEEVRPDSSLSAITTGKTERPGG